MADQYWQRRYLKDKAASLNRVEEYLAKQQKKLYGQAGQEIREQIEKLYKRFADMEQISLAEAKRRVSDADFKRIDWDGMLAESKALRERMQEELPEGIRENLEKQHQALDREMKMYAKRGRVSYLELRSMEIDRIMVSLYDSQQQNIYDYLTSEYDDGYYRSIYNTQQCIGFGYDFTRPNEEAVNTAILNRYDKRNFSIPALAQVETALLYQAVGATSEKLFSVDQFSSRYPSSISRRKMVATSARVTLPSGRTRPSG